MKLEEMDQEIRILEEILRLRRDGRPWAEVGFALGVPLGWNGKGPWDAVAAAVRVIARGRVRGLYRALPAPELATLAARRAALERAAEDALLGPA